MTFCARFCCASCASRECGCDWMDILSPEQLAQEFPYLNTDGIAAGSLGRKNEGSFDPWALLNAMKRYAYHSCVRCLLACLLALGELKLSNLLQESNCVWRGIHARRSCERRSVRKPRGVRDSEAEYGRGDGCAWRHLCECSWPFLWENRGFLWRVSAARQTTETLCLCIPLSRQRARLCSFGSGCIGRLLPPRGKV